MKREEILNRVRKHKKAWDIIIIGGGASGVGCAVDATSRGFDVLLLEQSDFGKGTSSRSTKLIHGGVRYLEQGNISLVREALKEREILKQNAPHLIKNQRFIIPCYSSWQKLYYGTGLKVYDLLAAKNSFGKSRLLSKRETLKKLPNLNKNRLKGGILYFDGQFNDTRLLIDLIKTASENMAATLNYAKVVSLSKNEENKINGVKFEDTETGEVFSAKAKVVINATGAFCDSIRELSDKYSSSMISASQGIHLVFDSSFVQGEDAIMIPKTSDGRVLFAIPWQGKTIVGTTDTPIKTINLEPKPLDKEIEFILDTCKNYLSNPPKRENILSVFAGIRPLVRSAAAKNTASLSRGHTIEIDNTNLLTLTGGKWTTYRHMAEDAVNKAIELANLPDNKCVTQSLKIQNKKSKQISDLIEETSELAAKLHEDFPYQKADVVNAVRNEMARTPEDVLARRTRILFLNAKIAITISKEVSQIMASELQKDKKWIDQQLLDFENIAQKYIP